MEWSPCSVLKLQRLKTTFRRVAYHTEQTVNCGDGDGGDKYWQIMRGSAESPERNGRLERKADISATEDRARNGARFESQLFIKFLPQTKSV